MIYLLQYLVFLPGCYCLERFVFFFSTLPQWHKKVWRLFFSFSFFFPQSSPLLCCPLWPVPCILKDLMQICWKQNALSTNVLPALAFLTAHPPLSLLVFPHPVSPIHFPFTAILMLLLQIYTIQMVREITLSFASPASLIKKEKKMNFSMSQLKNQPPAVRKMQSPYFYFFPWVAHKK